MSDTPTFRADMAEIYERLFVPMIFESYADDLAERVAALAPERVLEVAAGTGVVTRAMDARLGASVAITATDLSPAMLARATAAGTTHAVEWRPADAQELPFPDASFDVVVCQFGVMFFPDKARAFSEVQRVLRIGGAFLFNVWDGLDDNEFAETVEQTVASLFPDDPPRIIRRVPHGYHDAATIAGDLHRGGFAGSPRFTTLAARSHAPSAQVAAAAYCLGTPLRAEIEARDASRLTEAMDAAAAALAVRFGEGAIEGKIQAKVVAIAR